MKRILTIKPFGFLVAGLLVAPVLNAANFIAVQDQGSANTGNSWNTAIWTNAANPTASAPTSGNTYEYIGTSPGSDQGNSIVRSPKVASPGANFLGDALQMDPNTGIRLKSVGAGIIGVGDNTFSLGSVGLILNGGFLGNGDDFSATITSPITVLANSAIYAGQDPGTGNATSGTRNGFRNYIFQGSLLGSANLTLGNALMGSVVTAAHGGPVSTANFLFGGNGSGYSGNITVTSGSLQAGSAQALGTGNITLAGGSAVNGVNGPAQFDATLPFNDPTAKLTIQDVNSTLLLDNNMTFATAVIDGITIGPGTYTAAQLDALTGSANVVDPGGNNTFTVVAPEPSTVALTILSGIVATIWNRRRR